MILNFANTLTIIRIILTPIFVIMLIKERTGMALIVFGIAAVSDALDGLTARLFNQRTAIGAYFDPIADKLLMTSAFVSLAILKIVPGWLSVIVISRDLLIVMGLLVFTMAGITPEIKPTIISKITTVIQIATIIWVLLRLSFSLSDGVSAVFYWTTAVFTVSSCLHYIYKGIYLLQTSSEETL